MPSLAPIVIKSSKPWASGGIVAKPPECHTCPWANPKYGGIGFCPDTIGPDPKVALLFPAPSKDDVNAYRGLSGDMGHYIIRHYLEPVGFRRDNLLISNVLRCALPWDKTKKRERYPTGVTREKAEVACRIFDNRHGGNGAMLPGGIKDWEPNIALITFSPKEVFKVPAYHRQLLRDMEKVRKFVDAGYRPVVLFGNEPAEQYAPYIKGQGGAKTWRGHFFEI
jgi:hypothetical protein